jgi:hypothetical protein
MSGGPAFQWHVGSRPWHYAPIPKARSLVNELLAERRQAATAP